MVGWPPARGQRPANPGAAAQVQRDFRARAFSPGQWQIITVGGADAGMLHVEYRPGGIYLARIEIHPGYQGRGVGTRLLSVLIDEAGGTGQGLVLDVLTVNRRARALYQRLGMTEVATQGDSTLKITMRLPPTVPISPVSMPDPQVPATAHVTRSAAEVVAEPRHKNQMTAHLWSMHGVRLGTEGAAG